MLKKIVVTFVLISGFCGHLFGFKKYTIPTGNDAIICRLTVFSGEEMSQFIGSEHFSLKEFREQHMLVKVKVVNNSGRSIFLKADEYLTNLDAVIVPKQELCLKYANQAPFYKLSGIQASLGAIVCLGLAIAYPYVARKYNPGVLVSGGLGVGALFFGGMAYLFLRDYYAMKRQKDFFEHATTKDFSGNHTLNLIRRYRLDDGELFQDLFFINIKEAGKDFFDRGLVAFEHTAVVG